MLSSRQVKAILFLLFCFVSSPATSNSSSVESATINSIQAAWDKVKSFQADFEQTVTSKSLGTRDESRGVVSVKKPEKLRWEPAEAGTIQILNGKELWQIQRSKRRKQVQVDHYQDVSGLLDLGALSFLAQQINIKKSYKYKILASDPEKILLTLSPLKGKGETVLAEIIKPSYLLGALKMENSGSETRVVFKNMKTNVDLQDSLFRFEPGPEDLIQHHKR